MSIELILSGHAKDLGGGFTVRRLLPAAQRRSVGPFIFFDHFGPVAEAPGTNHDVRPHPHIGLATVTYLFDGAMTHRDSLGTVQDILPGAINWMTAGRGIVHSERKPRSLQNQPFTNHGLQLWAALPQAHEEAPPSFTHTPAERIPQLGVGDATVRVLIGSAFGATSPVATFAPTLYLDIQLGAGGAVDLPALMPEMAVYGVDNDLFVDGQGLPARQMATLAAADGRQEATRISASAPARLVVIGGQPLDGPRHMWWNFVSSRKERIDQAAQDWQQGRMGQVPDETEFIPLPARP